MNIFKNIYKILPITFLFLLLSVLLPSKIEAAQFHFKSYTLSQEQSIDDDIYAVGEDFKIDGVVNGDVVVLGNTIQLNGTVTGDVYLVAEKINIDATVYGNTFVFGNNTSIEGTLAESTYIMTSILNYNADTQKDLFGFFLESSMKGTIGDDLRIVGFRSNIESIVRGDAILLGDGHTVNDMNVTGDIFYNTTLKDIAKSQGVDIDDGINVDMPTLKRNLKFNLSIILINFLSMLLVGFVLITLTPVKSIEIRKRITDSTTDLLSSLGIGFLAAVIIPLPLLILSFSVIGTPLALLITGLLSFLFIFGKVWVELAFGKEVLELFGVKEYRPFKSFLIGRVITVLITLIPVVGGFYSSIVGLLALGAIIRMKNDYFSMAKKQVTVKKVIKKK